MTKAALKTTVKNPYSLSELKSFENVPEAQALAMLDTAFALFSDRKKLLSKSRRIEILKKMKALITEQKEALALTAAQEGGKPLKDSLVEVGRGINGIQVAIDELSSLAGKEIPMGATASSEGRRAYTQHQPRGVAFAISAFNHPFNLIVHQVVPAIATGCPVIVKPAGTTPLSCERFVSLLKDAGLPEGWCQMLICENEVAEKIATDKRVSFLTFIGSSKVGWYLRSKLSPGTICTLEHGGAAPAIIDSSANVDKILDPLVKGGFYHAGQVCVSVQRIFVHKSLSKEFSEKFVSKTKALKVGDPSDIETDVGPLILPKEVDRVDEWVQKAVANGAELLTGGKKVSEVCYQPTVLLNPSFEDEVSNKEIFGPVVCIYEIEDMDEAITKANDVDFAFQASVFSNDLNNVLKAVDGLNGLAIMVNDHTAFRVDWMPFGGYKESGMGVGGIGHTMKDMLIEKMFVINEL